MKSVTGHPSFPRHLHAAPQLIIVFFFLACSVPSTQICVRQARDYNNTKGVDNMQYGVSGANHQHRIH